MYYEEESYDSRRRDERDSNKKEKKRKPFWIVRWDRLKKNAPRNMSRQGEWIYFNKKTARRDIAFYSKYYENIIGPDPFFNDQNQKPAWSTGRR